MIQQNHTRCNSSYGVRGAISRILFSMIISLDLVSQQDSSPRQTGLHQVGFSHITHYWMIRGVALRHLLTFHLLPQPCVGTSIVSVVLFRQTGLC